MTACAWETGQPSEVGVRQDAVPTGPPAGQHRAPRNGSPAGPRALVATVGTGAGTAVRRSAFPITVVSAATAGLPAAVPRAFPVARVTPWTTAAAPAPRRGTPPPWTGAAPAPAGPVRRTGFTVAPDGSYAACLADAGGGLWHPERWTLGGPEPYTVPLPGRQPEEPDAQVLPLPDGRVLIRRGSAGRHDIALLYPTGPGTGELPVGFLHGEEIRLLPPLANGRAYALAYADGRSTVWLVHGGPGLERRAEIEGRCAGGVWLDRAGRMLALDRESGGRTKTVTVDVATGAVSPLLQIAEGSDDRLLLADADSGLLVVRSDAPGVSRLGWGVLGSGLPVRFPECLREADGGGPGRSIEPLAAQPGQTLLPQAGAVALRIGGRCVLWRPAARRLAPLPTPPGWLDGSAWWSGTGRLRLPYARPEQPYGVRDIVAADFAPEVCPPYPPEGTGARPAVPEYRRVASARRVLPLQQAPLASGR